MLNKDHLNLLTLKMKMGDKDLTDIPKVDWPERDNISEPKWIPLKDKNRYGER